MLLQVAEKGGVERINIYDNSGSLIRFYCYDVAETQIYPTDATLWDYFIDTDYCAFGMRRIGTIGDGLFASMSACVDAHERSSRRQIYMRL